MGAGVRRVAGRPGGGSAAGDAAQQTAAVHHRRARRLRAASPGRRDADPADQPVRPPLRPLDRRAFPPQLGGERGEDAVIISSQSKRGRRGARVVAAVDGKDPDEAAFDGWTGEEPGAVAPEGEFSHALAYHGVPVALARRLDRAATALAPQDATAALTAALDGAFGFQPLEDLLSPRPLMLVGPPGVGKTTVAAKLIVDAHRRGRKIVAVSCDLLRAGGIDQLQAFTRILGLALATADTPQALARIVAGADGSDSRHRHRRDQ